MNSRVVSLILILGVTGAFSAALLDSNDSSLTGSEVKEQIKPFEDQHEAGTESKKEYDGHAGKEFAEDDDEKGFYKSKSTKGNKGYKHFDSWHKKDGNKYGYESHSSNGMKKGDKSGGEHYTSGSHEGSDHHGAGSQKRSEKQRKEPKAEGTGYSYSHYESEGDDGGHYSDGDHGHYEGDSGHYEGDHQGYHDGEYHGDSGAYTDGGDGAEESESYEGGESEHYTEGEADDDGSHASYSAEPKATSYYIRHY